MLCGVLLKFARHLEWLGTWEVGRMVARTFSLSIALVTLLLAGRAHAVVKTWIGSDGGSFSTPGNWDPSGTPGTADSLALRERRGGVDVRYQFRCGCDRDPVDGGHQSARLRRRLAHALADEVRSSLAAPAREQATPLLEHVARAAQYDLRRARARQRHERYAQCDGRHVQRERNGRVRAT